MVSTMAVNEMRGLRKLLDDANPETAFERRRGKEGQYNKADGEKWAFSKQGGIYRHRPLSIFQIVRAGLGKPEEGK